jgi:hypothetical protein
MNQKISFRKPEIVFGTGKMLSTSQITAGKKNSVTLVRERIIRIPTVVISVF